MQELLNTIRKQLLICSLFPLVARSVCGVEIPSPSSADTSKAGIGATEEDYDWWRADRFGIFIHWGPGALVNRNSVQWVRRPQGEPGYNQKSYMAEHKGNPPPIPEEERVVVRKSRTA